MNGEELLAEAAERFEREDLRQDYVELRLSGCNPAQAYWRTRNRRRSFGFGRYVDLQDEVEWVFADGAPSITLDQRTHEEREEEWRRSDVIRDTVDSLSREYVRLLEMRYGILSNEEMSAEEIARQTGMSISAVERRLRRARETLAQSLKQQATGQTLQYNVR